MSGSRRLLISLALFLGVGLHLVADSSPSAYAFLLVPPACASPGGSRVGSQVARGAQGGVGGDGKLQNLAEDLEDSLSSEGVLGKDILDFLDKEVEKGQQELKNAALDAFGDQTERNEELAKQFADILQRESDALVNEMEEKADRMMDKIQLNKVALEREMREYEELQNEVSRDPLIQIRLFPQKNFLQKSTLVASILLANQSVYQVLKTLEQRGGSPAVAAAEAMLVILGLYVYGFRI